MLTRERVEALLLRWLEVWSHIGSGVYDWRLVGEKQRQDTLRLLGEIRGESGETGEASVTGDDREWARNMQPKILMMSVLSNGCPSQRIEDYIAENLAAHAAASAKPAPAEPQEGAVRVRVAVAVDADGVWYALGDSGHTDGTSAAEVASVMLGPVVSFIEADVPLPKPQTVRGRVVERPVLPKPPEGEPPW